MVHNFIDDDEEDVFFDSFDSFDTWFCSALSEKHLTVNSQLEFESLKHLSWPIQLSTVQERRKRFFERTGFDELLVQLNCSWKQKVVPDTSHSAENIEGNRQVSSSEFELSSSSLDSTNVYSDTSDCEKQVEDVEKMTLQINEKVFPSVAEPLSNEFAWDFDLTRKKFRNKKWSRWLKLKFYSSSQQQNDKCQSHSKFSKLSRTKSKHHIGRFSESTNFNMVEQTTSRKCSVSTTKLSPSGTYLASGGEDGIVRIWQVREAKAPCRCFTNDYSTKRAKSRRSIVEQKGFNFDHFAISSEALMIDEVPLHEFSRHTSDILDLAWSKSDILLSASKDKTVRMWRVGFKSCLGVFAHRDFVTCIQFNPVDERYFLSGSIDGKVRIWAINESKVVNWADTRSIVTAISYKRDGEGFVVGSLSGKCRFYLCEDNTMKLEGELFLCGKRKSKGKEITCLQYSTEDSQRVVITSSDSTISIYDGYKLIHKFRCTKFP